jgi:GR25 family glycosyltransferase involved in LPS biosynthesis
MKAFDYFDKTFCINLDKRVDRWTQVQQEFEKVGILDAVERFSALAGKRECVPGKGMGRHGLLRSVQACLTRAREEGAKHCLIFEDDVTFVQPRKMIDQIIAELDQAPEWDLFYLGALLRRQNEFKKVSDHLFSVHRQGLSCAHAWVCPAKHYDEIIDNIENNHKIRAIDDWLHGPFHRSKPEKVVYHANPITVIQRDSDSDLDNIRNKHLPILAEFRKHIKRMR